MYITKKVADANNKRLAAKTFYLTYNRTIGLICQATDCVLGALFLGKLALTAVSN